MAKNSNLEDNVRDRLRLIMRAANSQTPTSFEEQELPSAHCAEAQLRTAAFSMEPSAFEHALSSLLSIPLEAAAEITDFPTYGELMTALKALDISESGAYLLTAAVFPRLFTSLSSIGTFLERYRSLTRGSALQKVMDWRGGNRISGRHAQSTATAK